MFLIQFYKFVLFLKSITKLVRHCNKNDEIKVRLSNWKRSFRGKTEQRNFYMGPLWAFLGRWVTHNSVVRKIRIHMYVPISNLISS